MIAQDLLYASAPKHEVFRLIALALPEAGESRAELLDAVLLGPQGERAENLEERSKAYMIYNLLVWITNSAPDFTEASKALDQQQASNPEFTPRSNPDLSITFHGGFSAPNSPVTREQLERMTSPEDVEWMLDYQGELSPDSLKIGMACSEPLPIPRYVVPHGVSQSERTWPRPVTGKQICGRPSSRVGRRPRVKR